MKSIICALAALLLTLTLTGCGQSGPLYVPGDPSSIKVPPEAAPSDEESDENGDDSEDTDSQ
ncbi:MAG: lipoprotein [Gammaproteobacteria bacterium]|jgi:predicted small lipoprotein YifL|nr:lipoprotein [Gammaproteobacteria bacterium]MDH3749686.1 lipoprotein [Gammaproteobacteria bacterium]MDH3804732.1 lipoprotein [Gammaproteobacteria bacterium]